MKKYVKIKILVELQCHHKRITDCNLINTWSQIKCYTLLILIMNFWLKNRWMYKQSRKIFNNKNRTTYSMLIFNVNGLGIWAFRKQGGGRLYEKAFWLFKRTQEKHNWLWKEKNIPFNKKELKSHQDSKVCYIMLQYKWFIKNLKWKS